MCLYFCGERSTGTPYRAYTEFTPTQMYTIVIVYYKTAFKDLEWLKAQLYHVIIRCITITEPMDHLFIRHKGTVLHNFELIIQPRICPYWHSSMLNKWHALLLKHRDLHLKMDQNNMTVSKLSQNHLFRQIIPAWLGWFVHFSQNSKMSSHLLCLALVRLLQRGWKCKNLIVNMIMHLSTF